MCFIVLTTGKAWKEGCIKGISLTYVYPRRELKREGLEGASLTWWMKTTEQRTEAMIAKIPNPIIREKPATIRSIAVWMLIIPINFRLPAANSFLTSLKWYGSWKRNQKRGLKLQTECIALPWERRNSHLPRYLITSSSRHLNNLFN